MSRILSVVLACVLTLTQIPNVYPFGLLTHSALSERAVGSSNLDGFLKSELNFPGGINEFLVGMRVFEWVQEGSVREDDGTRPLNHFHNPLLSWGSFYPFPLGFSSICWAQETDCRDGASANDFSWQKARLRYFDALTAGTKTDRDQKLALTFETLGHLIHLVQDAAVPAHTRNDLHPSLDPDGLESFMEDIVDTRSFSPLTSVVTKFDESILKLTTPSSAPIPIARIIDTTDGDQIAAVPSTGTNIGLAEYSNANFLSDDTIFTDFVFPRADNLGTAFKAKGDTYYPYPKVQDGSEQIEHFVAQDRRGNYFLSERHGKREVPSSLIFTDYGAKLLPRAIGYSAGLIDYFFRGRMEVVLPKDQPLETEVRAKVRNTIPDEDTMNKPGAVVGVLRYLFSGQEFFSVSDLRELTLTNEFQELAFNLIPPDGAEEAFLAVVYKGQLGLEEEAVMQGKIPLVILKPKNPTLVCPDGSVNFTAVGGKLPYTWSTTKGVITPSADTKTATLTPPANTNVPGVAIVQVAHSLWTSNCTPFQTDFNCFSCTGSRTNCPTSPDYFVSGSAGAAAGCYTGFCGTCGPGQCRQPDLLCLGNPPQCRINGCPNTAIPFCSDPMFSGWPSPEGDLSLGFLCDFRTQDMIAAGCKPCRFEMEGGATVAVTDSATPTPASLSTTVTVQ